jgi:hypothetical protein
LLLPAVALPGKSRQTNKSNKINNFYLKTKENPNKNPCQAPIRHNHNKTKGITIAKELSPFRYN